MTLVIVENLRGFFNSRPPLVVFMICLASFAIALITFAYIVKTRDLPNPDVTEDWNTFLERLSHLRFCVSQNASASNNSLPQLKIGDYIAGDAIDTIANKITEKKNSDEGAPVSKRSTKPVFQNHHVTGKAELALDHDETTWSSYKGITGRDGLVNETFQLNIEFVPSSHFSTATYKSVHLTAEVTGKMISMKGIHRDQQMLVTVVFTPKDSDCVEKEGKACTLYIINSCVTFTGPASMLPHSSHVRTSKSCAADLGKTLSRPMSVSMSSAASSNRNWCSHGASLATQYSFDDSLTVLLSEEDRSLINLHLMRTSYFLFVMVVTLLCYAAVRGRPGKIIYIPHDKVKGGLQIG